MSMTLHDSLEIGNVFGSEAGFMEAKILQERYIIRDKCLRKGLPSSHNTNCKDFGSAFRSRGRHSSNETAQGGVLKLVWLLVRIHVSGFVERSTISKSNTKFIHTQVHILIPLGLSFTWLVESEPS